MLDTPHEFRANVRLVPTLADVAAELCEPVPESVLNGLMAELKLSAADARSVAREAARFLSLASRSDDVVVPSAVVDVAWHLWLLDSRHYFALCDRLGSGYLHHEPGRSDDPAMLAAYDRTRARMVEAFGALPQRWWGDRAAAGKCVCGRRPD